MDQTIARHRKVGNIPVLPNDDYSPAYGEIPLFYEGDDPEMFLGKVVKSVSKAAQGVGRVAQKATRTVNKTVGAVKRATGPLGAVTDFGWRMSPAGQVVKWGREGLKAASAIARGERIDRVLRRAAQAGIDDVRERMKFAEMVAPFVPGIGTGVAAALAAGKPITEALIAAARSAIPGSRIAQAGFDVAMNLAKGKNLSQAASTAARAQLPGGLAAQAAFDAGLALAQGRKLQQAAYAAAGRMIPPSPWAADALSFVRSAASGKNIQHAALSVAGRRVLQGKPLPKRLRWTKREPESEFYPDMDGLRNAQAGSWSRHGNWMIVNGV